MVFSQGYYRLAWLVEAASGEPLAWEKFTGKNVCPARVSVGTQMIQGEHVDFQVIIDWMGKFADQ